MEYYENTMDSEELVYPEVHGVAKKLSPSIVGTVEAEPVNMDDNSFDCVVQMIFRHCVHIILGSCNLCLE